MTVRYGHGNLASVVSKVKQTIAPKTPMTNWRNIRPELSGIAVVKEA